MAATLATANASAAAAIAPTWQPKRWSGELRDTDGHPYCVMEPEGIYAAAAAGDPAAQRTVAMWEYGWTYQLLTPEVHSDPKTPGRIYAWNPTGNPDLDTQFAYVISRWYYRLAQCAIRLAPISRITVDRPSGGVTDDEVAAYVRAHFKLPDAMQRDLTNYVQRVVDRVARGETPPTYLEGLRYVFEDLTRRGLNGLPTVPTL